MPQSCVAQLISLSKRLPWNKSTSMYHTPAMAKSISLIGKAASCATSPKEDTSDSHCFSYYRIFLGFEAFTIRSANVVADAPTSCHPLPSKRYPRSNVQYITLAGWVGASNYSAILLKTMIRRWEFTSERPATKFLQQRALDLICWLRFSGAQVGCYSRMWCRRTSEDIQGGIFQS